MGEKKAVNTEQLRAVVKWEFQLGVGFCTYVCVCVGGGGVKWKSHMEEAWEEGK